MILFFLEGVAACLLVPAHNVELGLIKYPRIVTRFFLHRLIKAPRIMSFFLGGVVVVRYFLLL